MIRKKYPKKKQKKINNRKYIKFIIVSIIIYCGGNTLNIFIIGKIVIYNNRNL